MKKKATERSTKKSKKQAARRTARACICCETVMTATKSGYCRKNHCDTYCRVQGW